MPSPSRNDDDGVHHDEHEFLDALPEGEWYTLDDYGMDNIKGRNNHLFDDQPDDRGGYTAICGNKNAPKHLSGKHLEPVDPIGVLLSDDKYCSSCIRKANVHSYLPEVNKVREAVRRHSSVDVDARIDVSFSLPVDTKETIDFLREVAYVTDAIQSDTIEALDNQYVSVESNAADATSDDGDHLALGGDDRDPDRYDADDDADDDVEAED